MWWGWWILVIIVTAIAALLGTVIYAAIRWVAHEIDRSLGG